MLRKVHSRFLFSIAIGAFLVFGFSFAGQSDDEWNAAAPRRHVESDLPGRLVQWGMPGTQIGDETINPIDRMEFVWVPASGFVLGTNDLDPDGRLSSAHPFRNIKLAGYWIAKYPVTWSQFGLYCRKQNQPTPKEPGFPKSGMHPVVNVSWQQAMAYAHWAHVTLPTEFQWEHAARGPRNLNYPWGDVWDVNKCANSVSHHRAGTSPVGQFTGARSGYGCYDMAGNVSQWCLDWESKDYSEVAANNPQGPESGTERSVRGGGWGGILPMLFRGSFRFHLTPDARLDICGFRCVATF